MPFRLPFYGQAAVLALTVALSVAESKQATIDRDIGVNRASRAVLSDLIDAERGQRGYLLTADRSYLAPYRSGSSAYAADMAHLRDALGPGDARVRRVEALADCKLTELARTIHVMDTEGFDAARSIVRTDVGRNCMEDARLILSQVQEANTSEIDGEKSSMRTYLRTCRYGLGVSLFGGIVSIVRSGVRLVVERRQV
ncbi:MAG: CHASE3 domain-containing protein [Janthinobacterium lividum]